MFMMMIIMIIIFSWKIFKQMTKSVLQHALQAHFPFTQNSAAKFP